MRRFSVAICFVLFSLVTSLGHSQTSSPVWFTLNAPEGSVITASTSITLRYGQVASTCIYTQVQGPCYGLPVGSASPEAWTSPQTFSPPVSVTVSNDTFGDPLPGVYKTVQIQEQSSPQTIAINGQTITVPSSPVWFTLNAPEGSVITASTSITLRYGQVASTCAYTQVQGPCYGLPVGSPSPEAWTSPQTFSPPVSVTVSNDTFDDPLPGVYKTVQIQEQSSPQTIAINGQTVTVPAIGSSNCQLVANPSVISFQNTTVGYMISSSASLLNNCSSTVTVSAIQIAGPYSVSGVQTPFSLAPNQPMNYTIVFTPSSAGVANGSINFVNSTNSGTSVTLIGTGVSGTTSAPAHSVSLSWTASSSQVSGYNVYRSLTSGRGYTLIGNSQITTTNFADQTVTAGTTYYYVVTALANGVESGYSNEASIIIPSP